MSEVLIQSNQDFTYLKRIREKSFTTQPFETDKAKYELGGLNKIHGLFEANDLFINPDITKQLDNSIVPPVPDVVNNNISPDCICERPAYITDIENSYIYPLSLDLYRCKVDDYIGNENDDIIMYRDLTPHGSESSKKEEMSVNGYNNPYNTKAYSQELNTLFLGASSSIPRLDDSGYDVGNLLKYDSTSWVSNWKCGNYITVNQISPYTFFANDMVEIADATQSGNYAYFEKSLTLTAGQTYCLSFFARVIDNNTKATSASDIDSRTLNTSSLSLEVSGTKVYSIPQSNYNITNMWSRISYVFEAVANTTIKISWTGSRLNPIRICGLLLEQQSYPSPYDNRFITYDSNKPISLSKCPILIYLNDTNWNNHSWVIHYNRITESSSACDVLFADRIGALKIGLEGSKFCIYKEGTTEALASIDLSTRADNFYNVPLSVFAIYNKTSKKFIVKVFSRYDSFELETSMTAPKTTFTTYTVEETGYTDLVKYNLVLGGTDPSTITNGYYRDLTYLPDIISDEEIVKINNGFFGVSKSEFKYTRSYLLDIVSSGNKTWEEVLALTSANEGTGYTLTNDAYLSGTKVFSLGDIVVCVDSFSSPIEQTRALDYWGKYVYKTTNETKTNITVLRASYIIEGLNNELIGE